MLDYDYKESFSKGWSDEGLWRDFIQAMQAGDIFEMDCIIRAQGAERPPVDARVFKTFCEDSDLTGTMPNPCPQQNSDELQLLYQLESLRDLPLQELKDEGLSESLTELSFFNKLVSIDKYQEGINYLDGSDHIEYTIIQHGFKPKTKQARAGVEGLIMTGRDLATWVHADNPMVNWMPVISWIIQNKVPLRDEYSQTGDRADQPFTTWGVPFLFALPAETLRRCGLVSFHNKWSYLRKRPETAAYDLGKPLSQTFAEGSPMHPSYNAMHAMAAYSMGECIKAICDNYYEMPTGRTLGEEIDLTASNNADARLWAGVHYLSDNDEVKPVAKEIGKRVAQSFMDRGIDQRAMEVCKYIEDMENQLIAQPAMVPAHLGAQNG